MCIFEEKGGGVKQKEARVMILNRKINKRVKLVSSFMNIFLVLAVLVVLFPLSTPSVKATTIFYVDWEIYDTQSYNDETFILYGDLIIHDGGSLTIDNCIIEMTRQDPEEGWNITVVGGGEFSVLNNSLITTNSTNPDPYTFKVQSGGSLTIQSSTVENMA